DGPLLHVRSREHLAPGRNLPFVRLDLAAAVGGLGLLLLRLRGEIRQAARGQRDGGSQRQHQPQGPPARRPAVRSAPARTKASTPSDSRNTSGTAAAIAPANRPRSAQNSARR